MDHTAHEVTPARADGKDLPEPARREAWDQHFDDALAARGAHRRDFLPADIDHAYDDGQHPRHAAIAFAESLND